MTLLSHLYRSVAFTVTKPPSRTSFLSAAASSLSQRPLAMSSPSEKFVDETITKNKIVVFSKTWCPYCRQTKEYFNTNYPDEAVEIVELDLRDDGDVIQDYLKIKTGARSVPRTFISGEIVGGNDDLQRKPEDQVKALIAKRS